MDAFKMIRVNSIARRMVISVTDATEKVAAATAANQAAREAAKELLQLDATAKQTAAEAAECLWKQFADPSQGERSAGSGGLNACDWSSLSELQTALPKKGVFQDGRDHASE